MRAPVLLPLGHLAHALPGGVVDVAGRLRRRRRRSDAPVAEVACSWSWKSHCISGRCGMRSHVAVGVVGVGLGRLRCRRVRAAQAVAACLAGFDQAGFVVGVGARPARAPGRCRGAASAGSCRRRRRRSARCRCPSPCRRWDAGRLTRNSSSSQVVCGAAPSLPEVLAAGGLDQPVERVVGVVVARLDALVAGSRWSAARRPDVGDVAGRVVGVVQVLHLAAGPAGDGRLRVSRRGRRRRCAG